MKAHEHYDSVTLHVEYQGSHPNMLGMLERLRQTVHEQCVQIETTALEKQELVDIEFASTITRGWTADTEPF